MIDIVVLTLKSTPQRTEVFRKRNSGSIKFTFHYGLDSSQIPAADYWRVAAPDRKESKITDYPLMSPAELACATGHHAILDNFVKSRCPTDFLVVLEDDVIVPEGTPLLLREISKVAQDGIVMLGVDDIYDHKVLGRTIGKVANGKPLVSADYQSKPMGEALLVADGSPSLTRVDYLLSTPPFYTAYAYMVSHSIAKRLLPSYEEHALFADAWGRRMRLSSINRAYFITCIYLSVTHLSHSTLFRERADREADRKTVNF